MHHKRITLEPAPMILPRPPQPAPAPQAFVLCPIVGSNFQQFQIQQWLYQRAFEEAQAVAQPSILERDLLGVWN